MEGFLADPVNFHVYLETYFKPQNIRDLIRRKIGNGNANYSIKNVKALPLDYLSYMVKSKHTFRYYNIAPETLEKARLYDETKRLKLEGLAKFKVLLPKNPTDLENQGVHPELLSQTRKTLRPTKYESRIQVPEISLRACLKESLFLNF